MCHAPVCHVHLLHDYVRKAHVESTCHNSSRSLSLPCGGATIVLPPGTNLSSFLSSPRDLSPGHTDLTDFLQVLQVTQKYPSKQRGRRSARE